MVREGDLSLRLIDDASGRALPEVSHGGVHYAVCRSGEVFRVEVQSIAQLTGRRSSGSGT